MYEVSHLFSNSLLLVATEFCSLPKLIQFFILSCCPLGGYTRACGNVFMNIAVQAAENFITIDRGKNEKCLHARKKYFHI